MKKTAYVLIFCALIALLTAGVSASPCASDAVCRVLSDPLRRLFSAVSSLFPFPLFEAAFFALAFVFPPFLFLSRRRADFCSAFFHRAVSFAGIVFSLFLLLSVLPARRAAPFAATPPSDDELSAFAVWLSDEANAAEKNLPVFTGRGTPPAFASASDLSLAVTAALRKTGLCPTPPFRVKATLFPGLLFRSGLLGYHAALTGEAIVDLCAPAYTVPFTAAHEAAHQAGILPEGEASYAAYLALLSSSDPALRYSGIMGALDAVLPLVSDRTKKAVLAALSPRVREDLALFDRALSSGGGAAIVADENAAAIRLRGGEGARSYELFPILACRRYLALAAGDNAALPAIY